MKIGAELASRCRGAREKAGVKKCPYACTAAFEYLDVEWLVQTAEGIPRGVVREGLPVCLALLERLAERKLQLRLVGAFPLVARQQPLHLGDLRVAEDIVLEVGETPPRLRSAGIQLERRFVGRLALAAPAEGFLQVSDGDAQPRLIRFEQRRALVGVERLLLPQHSRGDGGDRDPGLRAIRLDLLEISHSRLRLLEAPESHQRGPEPAIGQRDVGGLPQSVAQQSLGFGRTIGTQGERRKSAKRCHVIRILSEDFAEQLLRLAALIRHECGRRRLDPRPLRVGQSRALEGHERIRVLFELDEHIAVCEPRAVMVRVGLEHAPHLARARASWPARR